MEPQFRAVLRHAGVEPHFRQAPLQRHLAAFEADLVVTARARVLALLAAATRLALARRMASPEALADLLGTLPG